jgi:hypothetical protein
MTVLAVFAKNPSKTWSFVVCQPKKPLIVLIVLAESQTALKTANYQDYQASNHWQTTLIDLKSPINTSVSEQDYQDYQTSGNLEARPKGDPLVTEAEPDRPQGNPPDEPDQLGSPARPAGDPTDQPAGDPLVSVSPPDLFVEFFDAGLLPDLIVESFPPDSPSLPDRPAESPTLEPVSDQPCAQTQSEGSQPANEPEIEFIQINSNSAQPEPDSEPEGDQPVATLNEPTCPICGIELEPEPDSGLAACLGCGRLFKVEITPTSPDDDETPPETPNNNGHGGGIGEFSPPVAPAIPPESQTRMTERLPDGSIKLEWDRMRPKPLRPTTLMIGSPLRPIPEISLPNIESVEIPPVVVLDLETTDLDPAKWRAKFWLAVWLCMLQGKEVETLIICSDDGEANLLAQTFDYLRETCDSLGGFILTGYNLFDFDLPYLIERAHKLKVGCPFRYLKDSETGEIKRWKVAATEGTLRGDPLDYPAIATDLPIKVIDTLHLVCRWDYTAKALRNYDLKSVAAYFNVNQPDRPILSPDQILNSFQHDRKTFEAYLMADLRETYALFETQIKPYAGVAALTKLPLDQVATRSTAWVWQQILERHYKEIPQPDEKRKYEGGLVVSRKGLWFPCLKVDIASLYPTIMLAYRIHSRKDTDQIALRWLKTLTRQRLELKAKAKAGDAKRPNLAGSNENLLNSLYGFYGTGGYGFNDMTAAEKVTEIGRKVLTCMIAAIEDAGGIVVEADTDGIIVCYRNADPQANLGSGYRCNPRSL